MVFKYLKVSNICYFVKGRQMPNWQPYNNSLFPCFVYIIVEPRHGDRDQAESAFTNFLIALYFRSWMNGMLKGGAKDTRGKDKLID